MRSILHIRLLLLALLPVLAASAAWHSTLCPVATANVRYTASAVGRIDWVDCRNVSAAYATITVYRVYSSGTDTVASVICTNGVGRGAPTTNTWYVLLAEYLRWDGAATGTIRVITNTGSP
jgi:hypothetical protein